MPPDPDQQAPVVIDLSSDTEEDTAPVRQDFPSRASPLAGWRFPPDDDQSNGSEDDDRSDVFHELARRVSSPVPDVYDNPGNSFDLEPNEWPADDAWEALLAVPNLDARPDNPDQRQSAPVSLDEAPSDRSCVSLTEEQGLALVLQIFPDIAHDHVLQRLRKGKAGGNYTQEWCNTVISRIADDATYPKQKDRLKELKRKRHTSSSDDEATKEPVLPNSPVGNSPRYIQDAKRLLGNEFLDVPLPHIQNVLRNEQTPYHAYLKLHSQQNDNNMPFKKLPRPRQPYRASGGAPPDDNLTAMLQTAKKKCDKDNAKRMKQKKAEQEEQENERAARASGSIQDCGCCYTSCPLNRMAFCSSEDAHPFCYDCVSSYVMAEMSQGKCRPVCMDTSGCGKNGGMFKRLELLKALRGNTKILDKLEQMQQAEDIREAGLEGLEQCPFCDFQAEYPPVEVNKEFRCVNFECSKTSCRLCRLETHVPKSCEEHAKDNKLAHRHILEEALTNALTRKCNKCKKTFLKDSGCNKISCPTCHNKQCYCCGKDVTDYQHFSGVSNTLDMGSSEAKCPLYDNTEERHAKDVEKAERVALEKLRAENPGLSDADLKIKVSDKVQQAEKKRLEDARRVELEGRPHPPNRQRIARAYAEGVAGHVPNLAHFADYVPPGFDPVGMPYFDRLNQRYLGQGIRHHHHVHHHHVQLPNNAPPVAGINPHGALMLPDYLARAEPGGPPRQNRNVMINPMGNHREPGGGPIQDIQDIQRRPAAPRIVPQAQRGAPPQVEVYAGIQPQAAIPQRANPQHAVPGVAQNDRPQVPNPYGLVDAWQQFPVLNHPPPLFQAAGTHANIAQHQEMNRLRMLQFIEHERQLVGMHARQAAAMHDLNRRRMMMARELPANGFPNPQPDQAVRDRQLIRDQLIREQQRQLYLARHPRQDH
ncbi:hypothetical protein EJ05DRAFT_472766 [Pseudovirgaria hyperparasitica]|uniref:RING-type domain-containing protein n=1 Tax=Pseudovirgaria hyperparasitica TaxID=470096 RepID=A0A6A6WJ79_9PEZI|nr:uncharacterized protein EJ05DRAFT_472766 [Pseudovirgaria hyperparasitica]KAF2761807.1 hypothetical protein EJ05DRAFT_472766 [Pseudovirgaria hyperparasitica]